MKLGRKVPNKMRRSRRSGTVGRPLAFVKLSPTELRQLLTNILLISTCKLRINNRVLGEMSRVKLLCALSSEVAAVNTGRH